jgi:hypothetical protein
MLLICRKLYLWLKIVKPFASLRPRAFALKISYPIFSLFNNFKFDELGRKILAFAFCFIKNDDLQNVISRRKVVS